MSGVSCRGNEPHLGDCGHSTWRQQYDEHEFYTQACLSCTCAPVDGECLNNVLVYNSASNAIKSWLGRMDSERGGGGVASTRGS